ncbi:phosphoinositide-3-kinase-interacting protein 1 isoform X3 [Ursus maritimus]|uniref:Phosphoinositide-3-kinase-interacting protein 1 isoform X3 n=1 Tax=Ursus maritimus TaxID=29073 RepID=A0A8M1EXW4_URSMA|nr:phosphoinositide-3-kinase-interacting protein 1 isoform X3 [Ursus maritimus]
MKEVRMLLAWVQTFLISNMLPAEAYGSGGCFWDNGHLYRADQPSPAPGLRCLNWLEAQSGLASALESKAGNHSYCRNPDQDPRGPWCYVSSEAGDPEKRPCEDLRCPASTEETEEASEVPSGDEVQVFAPANALPARSEAAAVQPVIGISQRVRMNSKEKKDLGTLGYVLGITMMVIIIAIGAGIVLGYTYKSGISETWLREQQHQTPGGSLLKMKTPGPYLKPTWVSSCLAGTYREVQLKTWTRFLGHPFCLLWGKKTKL